MIYKQEQELWPEFKKVIFRGLLYWGVVHTIESDRL